MVDGRQSSAMGSLRLAFDLRRLAVSLDLRAEERRRTGCFSGQCGGCLRAPSVVFLLRLLAGLGFMARWSTDLDAMARSTDLGSMARWSASAVQSSPADLVFLTALVVLLSVVLLSFVLVCSVCFLFCVVLFTVVLVCFVLVRLVLCTRCPVWLFALGIFGVCPFWSSCVSHDPFVTDVSQCSCVSQRLSTVFVYGMVGRLSHLLERFVRFVRLTCRARNPFQPV